MKRRTAQTGRGSRACLRRKATAEAIEWFDREIDLESRDHVYGRECCANAVAAKGVCYLILGDLAAASGAFEQANSRIAQHPMALAGIEIVDRRRATGDGKGGDGLQATGYEVEPRTLAFEREMTKAVLLVDAGDVAGAVKLLEAALSAASPGNTGWLIPIDPLLRVWEHPEAWAPVLALLRERAL